jgi:solute carrier family 25 carnitine/acylcarnitine transporter 20/29
MPSSSSSPGAQINKTIDATLPPAVADKLPHLPETKDQLKADVVEVKEKSFAGLRSLAAGGFGGVCAVIVGHPFDLVKVRLQTAERGVYSGAFDVVRKSVAKNGLGRGLYAGVSAPLVGVTPMCMSFLSCNCNACLLARGCYTN